ncbi:MAG: glutamine synthetase, partial [Duncaniella freteri]|nr:glutamine synthetase [Duncaniella freteri]
MAQSDKLFEMSRNPLVRTLGDPMTWKRSDIIEYIRDNGIEMVNFMYPAADGRLKTLNFVVNSM